MAKSLLEFSQEHRWDQRVGVSLRSEFVDILCTFHFVVNLLKPTGYVTH